MKIYVDKVPEFCVECLFYKRMENRSYDYTYHKCKLTKEEWRTETFHTAPDVYCPLEFLSK